MANRFRIHPCLALCALLAVLGGWCAEPPPTVPITIEGWEQEVELVQTADGGLLYVMTNPDGSVESLTPLAFAKRHFQREQGRSFVNRLFNITSPVGILWVSVGLFGQALFTGRMLVQWLASERLRRSTIPVAFWWMSLAGATMLLAYFIWRRDIVGVLGQGLGWIIYVRNLGLIYGGGRGPVGVQDDVDPEPALEEQAR